jgi:hypothetical protein
MGMFACFHTRTAFSNDQRTLEACGFGSLSRASRPASFRTGIDNDSSPSIKFAPLGLGKAFARPEGFAALA